MSTLKVYFSKNQISILVLVITNITFSACIRKKNLSQHPHKVNFIGGKGGDGGKAEIGKNGEVGKDGKNGGLKIEIK